MVAENGDYLMLKHKKALQFAKNMHAGQLYGDKDYFETHLVAVVHVIADLLSDADLDVYSFTDDFCEDLLSCGYLHDILEDTSVTFSDFKEDFNEFIANVVYACPNEATNFQRKLSELERKLVDLAVEKLKSL